ncbi:MAG: DUF6174 domain-containing protein [Thiothrix sp.]
MTGITQGSSYRNAESSSSSQTVGANSAQTTATNKAGSRAVGSIQERQQQPFSGDSQAMINIIQLLIEQLSKWSKGKPQPQPQPKPLELSKEQDQAIRNHFGIFGALSYEVLDNNRDGTLSAGDELVISGGITNGEISRQKLTQKDVDAINGANLTDAQSQLDANRAKWEAQSIPDYSFTLERSCFCAEDARSPINIEVVGGKISSATFKDSGEPVPDELGYNKLTVDDLFDTIQQAIKDGAAQVDVTYDQQYGIPTSIYIDQNRQIADEEVSLTTSNFEPGPVFTTQVVGEEDGGGGPIIIDPPDRPPVEPPTVTTLALGEEDGGINPDPIKPPQEPPIATTKALGEEDGGIKPGPIKPPIEPPIATTLALGEEDGGYLGPPIKPPVDDPIATTQAIGEEDGGNYWF